jgi:hypothetical protein
MKKIHKHIDLVGLFTSGLCAIHCAAIPVLLSLGFLNQWLYDEHGIAEFIVLMMTIAVIAYSTIRNVVSVRRLDLVTLFGLGVITLLYGFSLHGSVQHWIMAIGGCIVAVAHFLSWVAMSSRKPQIN